MYQFEHAKSYSKNSRYNKDVLMCMKSNIYFSLCLSSLISDGDQQRSNYFSMSFSERNNSTFTVCSMCVL